MEEEAVTPVAEHERYRAVVSPQYVLSAHGRLRSASQFDVQVYALSALVHTLHALSESEEVLVTSHLHLVVYAVSVSRRELLVECPPVFRRHLYAPWVLHDADVELRGGYCLPADGVLHLRELVSLHHPLLVLRHSLACHLRDAEHCL